MSLRKPTLEDLVKEARQERVPEIDWAKIEEPLLARVAEEARSRAAVERYEGKKHSWVVGGMILAVAASIPIFWMATRESALDTTAQASAPGAGDLQWKDGSAMVRVTRGGVTHDATAGDTVAQGDVIEPKSGRVVFTRANPGAVTWDVEDNARVEVRSTRGSLVLALERGAVEAQVAPVANGEAFAVDVEGTRVAVHGTHLRVAREGNKTTVDLREGVISIGAPPRSGSTYGDLVTAPAHAEFDALDPHGTLKISHEVGRVRSAANLDPPPALQAREARVGNAGNAAIVPAPTTRPVAPAAAPLAASKPASPALSLAPAASPAPSPEPSPETMAAPVPATPTPVQVDPNPTLTIANAVRSCEAKQLAQGTGVVITVSSTLALHIGDHGMVESARFDPPLPPDVQQCAVGVIYGTRFATPGSVSVPIDFTP